ncbi:universal stress protein [Nocardioides jensenii]|uniref:universal stress protein n=1 Tax=Nocardioides jensenii TaxID=1843 RepID=UPI000830E43F|nr:universal stress protein [Nocardioides jensenii]
MTTAAQLPAGTIVVGIDGSTHSERALNWAIAQAQLEKRPLTLLHGANVRGWDGLSPYGVDRHLVVNAVTSEAQTLLTHVHHIVTARAPDLDVVEALVIGDPRQVLNEASKRASMLVLGSHGRGPMTSLQLGSVSLAVSRNAGCPVVILRPQKPDTEGNGIVVGIGGHERNLAPLEFAYLQASLRSLPLTVMHGFWDPHGPMGFSLIGPDEPGNENEYRLVAETIAGMSEKFPDVEVSVQLRRGLVEDCLIRAAKGMGMVVVGAHPDGVPLDVLTGSPTRALVEFADCMVAVVPSRTS